MTDEETPDVEEIKVRIGDEIPVEEEPVEKKAEGQPDVAAELRNLGRQFGETISQAWNSEERKEFETEVRKGVDSFVSELDKVFTELGETEAARKARQEATKFRTEVESSDISDKTKSSIAKGLHWLSDGLTNLADQFTPAEKSTKKEE
jgi:hypothetical protein